MSFVNALKAAFTVKNLFWSFLWIATPLVNTVSVFFVLGFFTRLLEACAQKKYEVRYDGYGLLFVKGLFTAVIILVYALPGVLVFSLNRWVGGALVVAGLVCSLAGVSRFAVTETFSKAFSPVGMLGRMRFWLAIGVSGVFAIVVGGVLLALGFALHESIVLPVILLALFLALWGSVTSALLGHAQQN